ncbi:MAG: HAD family hydrolase [Oscillospiraceae bacterium]|nr:HAD family hydrolase [Oscillospiraceae bacterium]
MTLIFDWDGTLHNTLSLYGNAFRTAYDYLIKEGLAEPRVYTDLDVSVYLGMNAPDMWHKFMPELPEDIMKSADAIVGREMVSAVDRGSAKLFDGALDMLDTLKRRGHTLLFLSNCTHAYQEAHRKHFDLDKRFSHMFCCEDYGNIPKEDIFRYISSMYEGPYVMIGDRASDIKVAEVNGIMSIGCTYGFGTEGELAGADLLAASCPDIIRCVEELSSRCDRDRAQNS